MAKRERAGDRFTDPTPENLQGQTNNRGFPLRFHFVNPPDEHLAPVRRLGQGSD